MAKESKTGVGRRQFLQNVGVSAAAAGAISSVVVPFATEARADSVSDAEKRKARYTESEEVKTYYRVNRYPT